MELLATALVKMVFGDGCIVRIGFDLEISSFTIVQSCTCRWTCKWDSG